MSLIRETRYASGPNGRIAARSSAKDRWISSTSPYVELPGEDHYFFFTDKADSVVHEVQR